MLIDPHTSEGDTTVVTNNIEWGRVGPGCYSTGVFSAVQALQEDTQHPLLNPEYEHWNVAIRVDNVVLYANSPHNLEKWLSDRLEETRSYIAELERKQEQGHRWQVVVHNEDENSDHEPAPRSDDPTLAAWDYVTAAENHPAGQVRMLELTPEATRVCIRGADQSGQGADAT